MARIVVVGNGMFGAAATRHLAEQGFDVTCIGSEPRRPNIRLEPETDVPAHAVYSSHNDAARLTRLQDRDPQWAEITLRALSRYRELEAASGVTFFHDVGCLIVSREGGDGLSRDPVQALTETGVDYTLFPAGDEAWRETWPELSFPATHRVAFEPGPAGYIEPKRVVQAQNVLAKRSGATVVGGVVTNVERSGDAFTISSTAGEFGADRVLITAGAFMNFNGLLPSPADVSLKSEVIVLGEVNEQAAADLARMPTVKYLLDPGDLSDIYMTPPVQYDDGRHYIKMGANTRLDQWFTELTEIQQWFNTDTDPQYLPFYEPALRALWPQVDFVSVTTRPCIITYTPNRIPLIEHVDPGLFVATAGNGGGAKGSDAWGEKAANLVAASIS